VIGVVIASAIVGPVLAGVPMWALSRANLDTNLWIGILMPLLAAGLGMGLFIVVAGRPEDAS